MTLPRSGSLKSLGFSLLLNRVAFPYTLQTRLLLLAYSTPNSRASALVVRIRLEELVLSSIVLYSNALQTKKLVLISIVLHSDTLPIVLANKPIVS